MSKNRMLRSAALFCILAAVALPGESDGPRVGPPRPVWTPSTETGVAWDSGEFAYDDSGNIARIGLDTFGYDGVDRLQTATVNAYGISTLQNFTYDRYGNLITVITTSSERGAFPTSVAASLTVDAGTNRLRAGCHPERGCESWSYDNDTGNAVRNERTIGGAGSTFLYGVSYKWDPAGAMTELEGDAAHERYVYDANDERVVMVSLDGNREVTRRWTWRDASNKVAREAVEHVGLNRWSEARDYVYRDGMLMASFESANGAVAERHYHVDHLGSPRLVTDAGRRKLAIEAYLPFGDRAPGEESAYIGFTDRMRFTGHERDGDRSPYRPVLDYMHARYYTPAWGRFLSVDPVIDFKLSLPHPQGWNRYAYVRNNPINAVDRDGRCEICLDNALGREQLAVARGEMSMAEYNQRNAARATGAAVGGVVGFGFLAATAGGGGGLAAGAFDLAPIARGNYIESALARAFGGGLPRTFPVIDRFLAGVATSVKSIDLLGKSYQSATRLTSVISGYADKLSQFSGGAMGQTVVNGADVTKKVLEVVIQRGVATPEQMAAIQKATEYAKTIDVTVKLIQVK